MTATAPLLFHVFPSFATGGAQMRFAAFANHYGTRFRHAVLAMDGCLDCRERISPDLDISYHTVRATRHGLVGNVRRFRAILRAIRPDVLVTSNWGTVEWSIAASTIRGLRHVHTEDGFGPEERTVQLRRRVLARRLLLRRSVIVLPSRVLWGIATRVWQLDPNQLRYIPNGIDVRRFAKGSQQAEDADCPVIGTVAGLRPEKNVGRLIRAFALVRAQTPARLVIVGDGPQREELHRLAAACGVAEWVTFAGHMADPADAYRGWDVFALSSDTEQMPLSVLEAMAAGLPVVATDVGDITQMTARSNTEFLSGVADDEEGLARNLLRMVRCPDRRLSIGLANRSRVEQNYAEEAMFRSYAEVFTGPAKRHVGAGMARIPGEALEAK